MCRVLHTFYVCGVHLDRGQLIPCLRGKDGKPRTCAQSIDRLPSASSDVPCPTCERRAARERRGDPTDEAFADEDTWEAARILTNLTNMAYPRGSTAGSGVNSNGAGVRPVRRGNTIDSGYASAAPSPGGHTS